MLDAHHMLFIDNFHGTLVYLCTQDPGLLMGLIRVIWTCNPVSFLIHMGQSKWLLIATVRIMLIVTNLIVLTQHKYLTNAHNKYETRAL